MMSEVKVMVTMLTNESLKKITANMIIITP